MIDEIYEVAREAAIQESWELGDEVVMHEERRWPVGPVFAWRVEFTRLDRDAIGFVRIDAKTLEVIATGWRAAEQSKVTQIRKPALATLKEARAAA